MDAKDPMTAFMQDLEWVWEPDNIKPNETVVFSFPVKSPKGSITRDKRSAIQQLEVWALYQEHWCQHKPSITITVKEEEWLEVGAFVYRNFDSISGVSFLPYSDHVYAQAPYQDCSEKEYRKLKKKVPVIDWNKLSEYESDDYTVASQELSCSGGACEIV